MSHNSLIWFIKLSNLFSSWLISCNLFVFLLQHLICPLFAVAIYQRLTVIPLPPTLLMWMAAQLNPRLAVVLWGWQSLGCGAAAVLTSSPAGWLHSPAVPVGIFSGLRWDEPVCSGHPKCRACPSVAPRAWQGHRSQPPAADEKHFNFWGLTHTLYPSFSVVSELCWFFAAWEKMYKS